MQKRLVDVSNHHGTALHTYPIVIDDSVIASEEVCTEKIALRLPHMVSWGRSVVRLADGDGRNHRRGTGKA